MYSMTWEHLEGQCHKIKMTKSSLYFKQFNISQYDRLIKFCTDICSQTIVWSRIQKPSWLNQEIDNIYFENNVVYWTLREICWDGQNKSQIKIIVTELCPNDFALSHGHCSVWLILYIFLYVSNLCFKLT